MKGSLKLIKGDIDNLDGRVIIYSKIKFINLLRHYDKKFDNLSMEKIIAHYFSNDKTAILDRILNSQQFLDNIFKIMSQQIYYSSGVKAESNELMDRILNGNNPFIIGFEIPIKSEKDFSNVSEDILYVGDYLSKWDCKRAIFNGSIFYNVKLYKQREDPKIFEEYKGEPIDDLIRKRFTDKMIAATIKQGLLCI